LRSNFEHVCYRKMCQVVHCELRRDR
jgi:hypothetical protein